MSQIYDKLRQIEMENLGKLKGKSLLKIIEEEMVSSKQGADLRESEVRSEGMEISSKFKEKSLSSGEGIFLPSSFLIKMVENIKKSLFSIYKISLLSIDKSNDPEFRKYSQKSVTKDIKGIDSVLNFLLDYVSVNTPIVKKNTIHIILDEVLETNQKKLQAQNVRIMKKYDTELSETFIHDEVLRFILNSVLQYTIFLTPHNGSIGILTKSLIFQKSSSDDKVIPLERQCSEILVASSPHKDPFEKVESIPEVRDIKKDDSAHLIFLLGKELIQKNQGMIDIEVDDKQSRTLISLRLPAERRKVVCYKSIKSKL